MSELFKKIIAVTIVISFFSLSIFMGYSILHLNGIFIFLAFLWVICGVVFGMAGKLYIEQYDSSFKATNELSSVVKGPLVVLDIFRAYSNESPQQESKE